MSQLLERSLILELQKVAVQKGIPRNVLLTGILPGFVAGIEKSSNDAAQTLVDLSRLNETERLSDGSVPLRIWLENAYQHTELLSLSGCEVFKNALIKMGYPPPNKEEPAEKNKRTDRPSSIKILFLSANPIGGRNQLAIGKELRMVEDAVLKAPDGRSISLIPELEITTAQLQRVLLEHEPTIVHFSGHGSPSGDVVLASPSGFGANVGVQPLSELFEIFSSSIRCVVLNACYSEIVAKPIAQHIDCVVGMSHEIDDATAIQFSASFYQAIAYHQNVRAAFRLGCNQVGISRLQGADIPQLLVKDSIDPNTLVLFPK